MSKTIVVTDALDNELTTYYNLKSTFRCGLLLGVPTADKVYVLNKVKIPSVESVDNMKFMDGVIVYGERDKVMRGLPGGVHIVGLFIYSEKSIDIDGAVRSLASAVATGKAPPVVLQLLYGSRRYECKNISDGSVKSSEVKVVKREGGGMRFKRFKTVMPLKLAAEVCRDKTAFSKIVKSYGDTYVSKSIVTASNTPFPPSTPVNIFTAADSLTNNQTIAVSLFSPLHHTAASNDNVELHLSGTVPLCCLCHESQTMQDVAEAFSDDLQRVLHFNVGPLTPSNTESRVVLTRGEVYSQTYGLGVVYYVDDSSLLLEDRAAVAAALFAPLGDTTASTLETHLDIKYYCKSLPHLHAVSASASGSTLPKGLVTAKGTDKDEEEKRVQLERQIKDFGIYTAAGSGRGTASKDGDGKGDEGDYDDSDGGDDEGGEDSQAKNSTGKVQNKRGGANLLVIGGGVVFLILAILMALLRPRKES